MRMGFRPRSSPTRPRCPIAASSPTGSGLGPASTARPGMTCLPSWSKIRLCTRFWVLDGKRVLVTGGTGSLGQALVRRLMSGELGKPAKVVVFSRDEAKQHEMRADWSRQKAPTEDAAFRDYKRVLEFKIGDVRDYESISSAVRDANIVFHAAALKQVPSCEYEPIEAVKTNVLGAGELSPRDFGERARGRAGAPGVAGQ